MGYRRGILCAGLALTLAACGPSGTQIPDTQTPGTATEAAPVAHEPEILGVVKVEFEHIGEADFSVNATVVETGVESQLLTRTGAVSFTQGARGAFTGPDHVRYLYGQLNVNNTGAARRNLTLLGINAKVPGGFQSLGDTSLAAASRANGVSLTAIEARNVLPMHRRDLIGGAVQVVNDQADFQAYREADITPAITNFMTASPYNGYAFPFGFVARSKTNANSRVVPTGTAAGTLTMAFRYPDEDAATTTDDLRSFTWIGLITADNENRETVDAFEADTVRACAAAQALYGDATVTMTTLQNLPLANCGRPNVTAQDVSNIRTFGPPSEPSNQFVVLDRSSDRLGVDQDKNGIRDDIDQVINKYDVSPQRKVVLRSFAVQVQKIFTTDVDNPETARDYVFDLWQSYECTHDSSAIFDQSQEIFAFTLDTSERYARYEVLSDKLTQIDLSQYQEDPTCKGNLVARVSVQNIPTSTVNTSGCTDGYTIGYFNGIYNTPLDVSESIVKLYDLFGKEYNGYPLRYTRFYNPSQGVIGDFREAFLQRKTELKNAWELRSMFGNAVRFYQYTSFLGISRTAAENYIQALLEVEAKNIQNELPGVNEQLTQKMKDLLKKKIGVVAIAHSQGNFFLNTVYDATFPSLKTDQLSTVHVAVPTLLVRPLKNEIWVTSPYDRLIKTLRLIDPRIKAPNTVYPETMFPQDILKHGFVTTYLNDSGGAGRSRLINLINQRLSEVSCGNFYQLDSKGTYLPNHNSNQHGPPLTLPLTQLGLKPGDCVSIRNSGSYSYSGFQGPGFPQASNPIAVFKSASGDFLYPGSGSNVYFITTIYGYYDQNFNWIIEDIPQDFGANGDNVVAKIPLGATALSLGTNDSYLYDNHDEDGDYGVIIARNACM